MREILDKIRGADKKVLLAVELLISVMFIIFIFHNIQSKPHYYIYVWDHYDDLRFLDDVNQDYKPTVVFLAGEVGFDIEVKEDEIIKIEDEESRYITYFKKRVNPFIKPDGIESFPVIRLNADFSYGAKEHPELMDEIVEYIVPICHEYPECQIDYEMNYYRDIESDIGFFKKLHERLPSTRLTIAANVGWCEESSELDKFSDYISEAVPMLYRMGWGDRVKEIKFGDPGDTFLANPLCRDSIALSSDEMDFDFHRYLGRQIKKIYLFNPGPWSPETYKMMIENI